MSACTTCNGAGFVPVKVCCGWHLYDGSCCGEPDDHQDACPGCPTTDELEEAPQS